jgi:hypothetical protein
MFTGNDYTVGALADSFFEVLKDITLAESLCSKLACIVPFKNSPPLGWEKASL